MARVRSATFAIYAIFTSVIFRAEANKPGELSPNTFSSAQRRCLCRRTARALLTRIPKYLLLAHAWWFSPVDSVLEYLHGS